ncbi:PKD domain-containing protein, partial [candidate division KSB1 bacterium]|nr:PKD domain-containing protein [candidate division KSB1 bacterium]
MKKSIIFGSIILIIGIQWSYPQSMNDKNRELNRNSKVGLPEFSPSDEERTTEFQQTGVQSQNEPPTIYNSYVLPQYGNRGSGVIFHYRIFYQDPEGQAPAIRNLYINESSQPLQMQIAAAGSYTTGKELYYDLSVDSPLLINGANHYYMEVSDDNTQNLVRDPETGFYAFPFVGTDFDAEFVGTPTFGAAPLKVQFTDQSTGDITGWSWSFGDGGGAISRNPYHIYNNPGTYTVSLKILGPAGSNTETKVDYITVQGGSIPPTANFSASPTSGPAPLFVQFTNLSTGDITSYSWTFGDGGTSTSANPTHTYNSEGTYTVALTVTGPAGTHSKLMPALIHVGSQAPVANFTASPRSGDQPLTVQFNDLSTGEITSRTWFFGDGGSSSLTNPSHVYTQAGTFTVSLTINGPGGSDTSTKEGFITVNPTAGPVADFSGNPTSGTAPLSVQFTDLSSGNITSRTWNFGDGSSSTATNPSHTYTQAGIYSVNLTVSGPDGSNTITKSNYITVTSGGTAPVANFTGSPTSGNSPLSVQFTDQSTGTITSRSWNFGDGGSSTLTNPGHI